ncbi:MAG: ATP-binding cassette domain-containing protein [Caldilineaceae bacterium]|nr:ATP-binding cassette domain-containing protein [Caldilineaceae bacterium]
MIVFEHVTFTYPQSTQPALRDISLELAAGDLVLLIGHSGAGKSTLLRCLNGLVPHFSGGVLSGNVRVNGLDPVAAKPQVMSRHVGFVFQDPESQFVMDRVEDEIAFALENAAMPPQEMRVRVEETLDLLDLEPLRDRALATLSGGEKQRVAIAAALALRPDVLVLDEPTSQLDPKSAEDVLSALVRLNQDLGLTVILAEHRLERVLPFVDTVVYLPQTGAPQVGPPATIMATADLAPPLVQVARLLDWTPVPLTIKDGLRFSRRMEIPPGATTSEPASPPDEAAVLRVDSITVDYATQRALDGVSVDVRAGEVLAVMGRNGSGKSTLLRSMVGLVRPQHGDIRLHGASIAGREVADICREVGYLPQDPNALLFAEQTLDELEITLRNHGLTPAQGGTPPVAPLELLRELGLAHKAQAYPRDLSVGERQRVALGAITVTQPAVLLLDEPTRGLDYDAKAALVRLLRRWRGRGMAIALVTHDVELAAQLADRVVLMSQGQVIATGAPATVMAASPLFAPQVARLFPGSGWMTTDDVRRAVHHGPVDKKTE